MKEMRGIHKFTWLVPSAARLAALALGILATTGVWADTLYWGGASGADWNTTAAWFTDAELTLAAGALPSATDDVVLNMTGETVSVDSITAASLTVNGFGTINVSGDVNVSGTVTFTPDTATKAIIAAHPSYTLKLAAARVSAGSLNGGATIETTSGVSTSGGTFYGTISGAGGLNATGNFVMQGRNTYTGALQINGASVSLSSYLASSMIYYNFDASDIANWVTADNEGVTEVTSMRGATGRTFASKGTANISLIEDQTYFGGARVMKLSEGSAYRDPDGTKGIRSSGLFIVYQSTRQPDAASKNKDKGSNAVVIFDSTSENDSLFFGGEVYNGGGNYYQYPTKWYANKNQNYGSNSPNNDIPIYCDGAPSHNTSYVANKKSVLSVVGMLVNVSSNRSDEFGRLSHTYDGAVAEVVGLNATPSLEGNFAIEAYLMNKWNCTDVDSYKYLPNVDVALADGATLDMGGLAQTVKSLSGSGTVQNGTLTVTDAINLSAGETLTLPNTASFTLGTVAAKIEDTTAGTVTLFGSLADAISAYSTGTLTILQSLTDVNLGTTEISISGIVLADGVSAPTFAANPPYSASYTDGTIANARVASTFVWTPADASTDWASLSNWRIGEAVPVALPGSIDEVSFTDASFTDGTTELTVNVAADVDPSLVTIAPAAGHTYKFAGTGKVTTADLVVAKSGEGAMILEADVFSGKSISNTGSGAVIFNADVNLATLSATVVPSASNADQNISEVYATIAAGKTLSLADVQTITHPLNILGDLSLTGSGTYRFGAKYKGAGNVTVESGSTLRLQHFYSGGTTILTYSDGYTGDFTVNSGATLVFYQRNKPHNSPFYTTGGAIRLNGGTVSTVSGSANTVYLGDIEAVNGTESTITSGDTRYQMYISGAITGSGTINITTSKVGITGATSAFTGALNWTNATAGDNDSLSNASTSADATYNVTGAPAAATQLIGLNFSGTAEMGAFNVSSANAQVGVNNASVALEIGAKADSTINGQFITNPLEITKVGATSKLSLGSAFSMVSGSTINISKGTFETAAKSFTGVNFTFANGTKMAAALADESASTDDVELMRTTGTITLTGVQTVTLANSTASGVTWILKTEQIDADGDTVADTYVLYATPISDAVVEGVTITGDWLTAKGLTTATTEELAAARAAGDNSNGYSHLACYALGLDPTDKTDKPIVTLVANSDGTLTAMLVHPDGTEISAADTVTLTTTYTRYTSPNAVSGTELTSPNAISVANAVDSTTGVGYIKATVSISAK